MKTLINEEEKKRQAGKQSKSVKALVRGSRNKFIKQITISGGPEPGLATKGKESLAHYATCCSGDIAVKKDQQIINNRC